jgi:hypothetical protein
MSSGRQSEGIDANTTRKIKVPLPCAPRLKNSFDTGSRGAARGSHHDSVGDPDRFASSGKPARDSSKALSGSELVLSLIEEA